MVTTNGTVAQGATVVNKAAGSTTTATEVPARATRRRFSAAYKRRILEEADRCGPGEQGALLRREGLYSSHLTKWRRQRAAGALQGRGPGQSSTAASTAVRQVTALEREVRRLRQKLDRAETIIAAQSKLCALWNLPTPPQHGSNG
jgi:transposase